MQGSEPEAPKISVLMSVYNPADEGQLRRAVDSIVRQSFSDWEMILYDDGSCARGRKMIRRAARMDPRIRLVRSNRNKGLAHGMNHAIRFASGTYLARMDGDDLSRPDRLRCQVTFLEEHPEYQWVGCSAGLMDARGIWGSRRMPERPEKKDFLPFSPYIHPSVMFRRSVLEECGGYRELRRGEDYELFMRLHAAGYRGYNLQEELYDYRENRDVCRQHRYDYQIKEAWIRLKGFSELGILGVGTAPYVAKPLLVGLLPGSLSASIKKRTRGEGHVAGHRAGKDQTV